MHEYIFLDTWVLSSLTDPAFGRSLGEFLRSNRYTIVLSALCMVELYNPGWANASKEDRTTVAARFCATHPCVVVDPAEVRVAEIANRLEVLPSLPTRLDLQQIAPDLREEILVGLWRRDKLFLDQGIDIQQWSRDYHDLKARWLADVQNIINHACHLGNLRRNQKGKLTDLVASKEQFLLSLDLRDAPSEDVDEILAHQVRRRFAGAPVKLGAVRFSSLLFWYSYVEVDPAAQMKREGSDIGDIHHLSLIPYCLAFTADTTMHRMLMRIKEPAVPIRCKVLTKPLLKELLGL